jgi:membrane protein involved in colicin uptake
MATKKKAVKKKASKKAAPAKKAASKKKAAAKPKTAKKAAPKKAAKKAAVRRAVPLGPTALTATSCGPGKRCRQKATGGFIRQNFIGGRWVQVGGTVFPTLEACMQACGG